MVLYCASARIGRIMTTASTWQCKCGVNITVIGEFDSAKPSETIVAECPKCGDRQTIYAHRILSIMQEQQDVRRASVGSARS